MKKGDKKIPYISENTSYWWNCPNCKESNSIEMGDDSCFDTPLKCDECNSVFEDYESDI